MKATARLRESRCQATWLGLSVKMVRGPQAEATSLHGKSRLRQTEDERVVLAALDRIWGRLPVCESQVPRILRVSVVLGGLVEAADSTPDLLDWASPNKGGAGLSQAIAAVHRRFGRDSLVFGDAPRDREAYAGDKIAFARVPSARPGPLEPR